MDYAKRIKKLQAVLRRQRVNAILITQPDNRRYLCGYTGSDHGIGETPASSSSRSGAGSTC